MNPNCCRPGRDPVSLSTVLRDDCNLLWMTLLNSPVLMPVRWKWRELKTQSAWGDPRGMFKTSYKCKLLLNSTGVFSMWLQNRGSLSRGVEGGRRGERSRGCGQCCWLDSGVADRALPVPDLSGFITVMLPPPPLHSWYVSPPLIPSIFKGTYNTRVYT